VARRLAPPRAFRKHVSAPFGGLRAACRSAICRWAEPNRRVVGAEIAVERPQQTFSETHRRCALTDMAHAESVYHFRWRRPHACATGSESAVSGRKAQLVLPAGNADHEVVLRCCRLEQSVQLLHGWHSFTALVSRVSVPRRGAQPRSNVAQRSAACRAASPEEKRRHRCYIASADLELELRFRVHLRTKCRPVHHRLEPVRGHSQRIRTAPPLRHRVECWNFSKPESAFLLQSSLKPHFRSPEARRRIAFATTH